MASSNLQPCVCGWDHDYQPKFNFMYKSLNPIQLFVIYLYFCSPVAPKANIVLCATSASLILTIIVNGSTTVLVARIIGKQTETFPGLCFKTVHDREALPGRCPRSLVGILKCLVSAFCQGYTTLSEI